MSITRKNFTRQYEHIAVIAHGAHPEYRLEFSAPVKDEADSYKIFQGSVVSLNDDGQFVAGCAIGTGVNFPVPMISMKNIFDPDVTTGVTGVDYTTSTYSSVGGNITAIPCTGSYEIETTEFTEGTYKPNDGVIVDGTNKGKVTVATAKPGSTEVYVGFVSRAPYKPANFNQKRLAFFTNFIPGAHA